jgi:uncharacterized damage-inducible protein DinB
MEEYIKSLSQYNIWANGLISDWIRQLSDEQWTMPQQSSFPTIADTVAHIIAAEAIWLQRLTLVAEPRWIGNDNLGTRMDYITMWSKTSKELKEYCDSIDKEKLEEVINFKRLNGEAHSLSVQPILGHVFNHSTYHRGQIVTMMRGVGYDEISSTDLSTFFLKEAK